MDLTVLAGFEVTDIATPAHLFAGTPNVTRRYKFADKAEADAKLLKANAIISTDDGPAFGDGVITVVHVGQIVDTPGTYGPDTGEELTPPTYVPGWHVDILTTEKINEQSEV